MSRSELMTLMDAQMTAATLIHGVPKDELPMKIYFVMNQTTCQLLFNEVWQHRIMSSKDEQMLMPSNYRWRSIPIYVRKGMPDWEIESRALKLR